MKITFLRPEDQVTEAWGHRPKAKEPTVTVTVNHPAGGASIQSIISTFAKRNYEGLVFS